MALRRSSSPCLQLLPLSLDIIDIQTFGFNGITFVALISIGCSAFTRPNYLPNPEDKYPLKAVLGSPFHSEIYQMYKSSIAHDSLVNVDHPLHIDGVNGVQLYLGT